MGKRELTIKSNVQFHAPSGVVRDLPPGTPVRGVDTRNDKYWFTAKIDGSWVEGYSLRGFLYGF